MGDENNPPHPKFPYLKRGTGSQKFNEINYINRRRSDSRASEAQQNRPESSQTSGRGSAEDGQSSPRNGFRSPRVEELPPTTRPDSGFSDHGIGLPSPPPVETSSRFGQTVVSELSDVELNDHADEMSTYDPAYGPTVVHDVSDIISVPSPRVVPNEEHHESEDNTEAGISSLRSLVPDLPRSIDVRGSGLTLVDDETRNSAFKIRKSSKPSEPSITTLESDSSANDRFFTSTPVQSPPLEARPNNSHQPAVQKVEQLNEEIGETPILSAVTPARPQSASHRTADSSHFQIAKTSSESEGERTISARNFVAHRDRPINDAFPSIFSQQKIENGRPLQPSQATRYPVQPAKKALPKPTNLRRIAANNNTKKNYESGGKAAVGVTPESSDADAENTPRIPRLPKTRTQQRPATVDPVVLTLRQQLASAVSHVDLAHSTLMDRQRKFEEMVVLRMRNLEDARILLEGEKEAWKLQRAEEETELQRQRVQLKKDRDAMTRRDKERNDENEKEREANRARAVTISTKEADTRVKLAAKEEELRKTKMELDAMKIKKERADATVKRVQDTRDRELKTKDARINELEKQLTAKEKGRRTVGLAPRNRQIESILPTPEPSPVDNSSFASGPLRHDSTDTDNSHNGMVETRRVRFAPVTTEYGAAANTSYPILPSMHLVDTQNTPMGICQWYKDPCEEKYSRAFRLRHVSGVECGAKIYKYHNNNNLWIYGPLEVYYHSLFPTVVELKPLNISFTMFRNGEAEVRRPNGEVTQILTSTGVLTDTRLTRNGHDKYFVRYEGNSHRIIGRSDRKPAEDQIALRRGTPANPSEWLESDLNSFLISSKQLNGEIDWWHLRITINREQPAAKMEVGLLDKRIVSITMYPRSDWIFIRHKTADGQRDDCCDIGQKTRHRERAGKLIASEPPIQN